ncbi:MAG TPA: sigma-70 family RNA polymerase sigma factor [Candidatus Paceibacterota bacterium]|nr:sigma-70 family RNA polymerase sigma factor [Candidatus Paceibacterota bacterium]
MQNRTDAELLRDYATTHSEPAFGEIVRRYADAVYSAALRQVGNEQQARDVAQTVFVDLARKAASLGTNTVLIGWLHRGARLAALELLRSEQRRFNREQQAMELHDSSSETEGDWSAIRPILDEAIANLGDEDRNALLLRFFKNESLSSVGATLGVSEDAAQKRVSRALNKLRDFLAERGIKTTAAALSITLAANTVQSAPSGFALTLAAGALTKAAVATGTSTTSLFTVSNMKMAFLTLALVGSIAITAVTRVQSQRSLREAQALAQQQAGIIDELRVANELMASRSNDVATLQARDREVLRLRGEVTRLQRERLAQSPDMALAATTPQEASIATNLSPKLLIRGKFVTIPTDALKALSSAGLPTLGNGMTALLTEEQSKLINDALDGANDAVILQKPRIITAGGVPASLSATRSVPWGDTNVQVGITMEVNPELTLPSIHLGITARMTELVDVSQQQDGSRKVLQEVEIPSNVTLFGGQTVVLVKDVLKQGGVGIDDSTNSIAGPKTLLVFVTPSVFYGDSVEPRVRLNAIVRKAGTNSVENEANSIP